jgi:UDP-N-acetylglucosamine 1-carboxyvinyltransferase
MSSDINYNLMDIKDFIAFDKSNSKIPGYKHLVVQVLCSTVLFPEIEFTFSNIPKILDTQIILKLLDYMGASIQYENENIVINTKNLVNKILPVADTSQVHGTLYLFPALFSRFGSATIGKTGGCSLIDSHNLGSRPYLHIKSVLEKFGAVVEINDDQMLAKHIKKNINLNSIDILDYSSSKEHLTGPYVSGACKTALLCSLSLSSDIVFEIKNSYLKPDVVEFYKFINLTNFNVELKGNSLYIKTISRSNLNKKVKFVFMDDISTLMTYICFAVMFNKDLMVTLVDPESVRCGLQEELKLLKKMGLNPMFENNVFNLHCVTEILPLEIDVYSTGIYSDHQPFFALMLTKAKTKSVIREHVWKNRFSYAHELNKLGYYFEVSEGSLVINPSNPKHTITNLCAQDLRSAAVLSIGACLNNAQTTVTGINHLNRGYENLLEFLSHNGVKLQYESNNCKFNFK